MKSATALTALLLVASTSAFAPASRPVALQRKSVGLTKTFLSDKANEDTAAEAVFVPPSEAEDTEDDAEVLDKVEKFGKGAAKVSELRR